MTFEEREEKLLKFLEKLQDEEPLFELRNEFGKFLFRHINDLNPQELERYKELKEILSKHPI